MFFRSARFLSAAPLLFALAACTAMSATGCAGPTDEEQGESEDALSKKLPDFDSMWANYPKGEIDEVKAEIGGAVDADWITNTCTIRMSRALNYSGFLVPKGPKQSASGFHTVKGADGLNYGFRVLELIPYLTKKLGAPTVTVKGSGPNGVGVDPEQFKGKKGIVVFVASLGDATGHADLWDGSKVAHGAYWEQSSIVRFWQLGVVDEPQDVPVTDDGPATDETPATAADNTPPADDFSNDGMPQP